MFEGLFAPTHLILVLIIVLIVFGPGKLPELGEKLGKSIKGFKEAVREDDHKANEAAAPKEIEDKK